MYTLRKNVETVFVKVEERKEKMGRRDG